MTTYRILKGRTHSRRGIGSGPVVWRVQRRAGYTDGRPSWRLDTKRYFYTREQAQAYIDAQLAPADREAPRQET